MLRTFYRRYKNKKRIRDRFPLGANVSVSEDFLFGKHTQILVHRTGVSVSIAKNVLLRDFCNIIVQTGGSLTIEENVFVNNYCSINCLDNILIGANTLIGEGVKFYDHNHKVEKVEGCNKIYRDDFTTAPIKIGRDCWIGSNVTILKGVTIGNNVVIGANNLIFKSIPDNVVVKSTQTYQY